MIMFAKGMSSKEMKTACLKLVTIYKHIRSFIGLSDIKTMKKHMYSVHSISNAVLHNELRPNNPLSLENNLTLLKLHQDARFETYIDTFNTHIEVQPICLPLGKNFPDRKGKAFVAGWGRGGSPIGSVQTVADDGDLLSRECITNEFGLFPFTQCKFPFQYGPFKMTWRLHTVFPLSTSQQCKKLITRKHTVPLTPPKFLQVRILDERNEEFTDCHKLDPGLNG